MPVDADALLPSAAPVQLIDHEGRAQASTAHAVPSASLLLDAYRALVVGRRINEQCSALVRQGRLAVYPSSHGQEACQVAAAMVLREQDWLFPTYRDSVAVIARGVSPRDTMELFRGDWHIGYDAAAHRVAPQATPLATQLLHAVGVAHAAVLRGEDVVVVATCGDGATSEGDFHEALNFAAVFRLPVVFLVQNNEFAISVPLSRQSVAPSLAHKAIGYGMRGERVDGNDVAALLTILGAAVDRARDGDGPTLVEAHTYRMQAHTNADDDTRYRERDEVQAWVERDPIDRLRAYLTACGDLDEASELSAREEADRVAGELRAALHLDTTPDPEDLFRFVYAVQPPHLRAQAAQLRDELTRTEVQA